MLKSINNQILVQVQSQIRDQIWEQVLFKVSKQLYNQVWDQIKGNNA